MSSFNALDYIPHGLVVALGGIVGYVFKEHTARDDKRFDEIKADLQTISTRQVEISDKMAENHAEILRTLLAAAQHAELNADAAERRG
jgi:hypothetical protein